MPGSKKDQKQAARELCEAAKYPPDDGRVDIKAAYSGEMTKGYWPEVKTVRWKPATIADLDNRVIMGQAVQVWYAATWIQAPQATEVEFQFQGHPQTYLRWTLNGEAVPVTSADYKGKDDKHPVATKSITLRPGWNQVLVRGYCVGYSPFRTGLVLNAPEEQLWKLKLSAMPPE